MTATAPQIRTKTVAEVLIASFGFATKLGASGTLLNGSPTVTASPAGPTISSVIVSTTALTIAGRAHAIGEAIQAEISGGTAGVTYTLTITAPADSGETLVVYATMIVET